jgi:hypothetical protein
MNNISTIEKQFKKIGADVAVNPDVRALAGGYSVDFRDGNFLIAAEEDVKVEVVDVDAKDRHLLLNVTVPISKKKQRTFTSKHKILCGHDERDYFVAVLPDRHTVKNVAEAKNALKPDAVRTVENGVKTSNKNKRKLKERIRQGEWFFIKAENITPDPLLVRKNEPITRNFRSKPHVIDEVYRTGGTSVRVCTSYPTGITEGEYQKLIKKDPKKAELNWRFMTRDASVYARGNVRHPDHETITLDGWHLVVMNTEASGVFLD